MKNYKRRNPQTMVSQILKRSKFNQSNTGVIIVNNWINIQQDDVHINLQKQGKLQKKLRNGMKKMKPQNQF